MPSALAVLAFCAVVGVGGFVQAVTGFGFALLVVPVTVALIGPEAGIGLVTAVGIILPAVMAWDLRRHIDPGAVTRVVVAAAVGAPFGLLVLTRLPADSIRVLIAVSVLISVVVLWRNPKVPHLGGRSGERLELGAGLLSGAIATSTGTNGPPVVLALQAQGYPPDPFRATLCATFASINAAVLAWFIASGQLVWAVMPMALYCVPLLFGGWWIGTQIRDRVPAERFRLVVLALLTISAVASVVAALA